MKIFFVNGIRAGDEIDLAMPVITVGRESDSLLMIPAPGMSKFHGRFVRRRDGNWTVEDTDSINGIKVNGRKLEAPVALREGDLVEFGDQTVRVTELAAVPPQVIFSAFADEPESAVAAAAPSTAEAETSAAAGKPASEGMGALEAFSEALKNGKVKLFGSGADQAGNAAPPRPRRFSNRFFYIVLGCVVVMAVSTFYLLVVQKERPAASSLAPDYRGRNLLLFYEKELISDDNVFRFTLHIENGAAEFTIDDIKSRRHFNRKIEAPADSNLEALRNAIDRSGFMLLSSPAAGISSNVPERRRLVVGDGQRINDVTILNSSIPDAFADVEFAVNSFSESHGLQTIALSPEELIESAEAAFAKAEDLFANRNARTENLREAINRYRIAGSYLEQFSPKPEIWEKARKRLEEAENIRKQRLSELNYQRIQLSKLQKFEELRSTLRQLMDLADPDSKEYDSYRDMLFKLERYLNRGRR